MKDILVGYVERITFQNNENGYTVAHLQQPNKKDLVCIVGTMPNLRPGETVRCDGEWKMHLLHGRQFEVASYELERPSDLAGILKYLSSGLIRGIGPKFAEKIVAKFGVKSLEVIETNPGALRDIPGIGAKKIASIESSWESQRTIRTLILFLQQHEISPSFAQKIFKTYGAKSIEFLERNPYALARDIAGIGFKTADQLAQKLGIAPDSPARADAAIEFFLQQLAAEGHVCYPEVALIELIQRELSIDHALLEQRVRTLAEEKRIERKQRREGHSSRDFVWWRPLYIAETGIAKELARLKNGAASLRHVDAERAVAWAEQQLHLTLAAAQKQAVLRAIGEKIMIITGGPGTGKSTITKAILRIVGALTDKVRLAAPTGRAAKRMSEITQHAASTVHVLLQFNPRAGGFKHNRNDPIDCDFLVVDEASMIDVYLMYSLLKAIPSHAKLLLLGDVDQLPSVGPGNVLKEMIRSLCIPVVTLTEIFRQAAGSFIITNAHRINQGLFPLFNNELNSDFFFIESNNQEKTLEALVKLVSQRIPNRYNYHPIQQIQVLAPMKRGIVGIENLNNTLQQVLNGQETRHITYRGQKFLVGDKIIQTKNNYQKEVFNGDIGYVAAIDTDDQTVTVRYDEKEVQYEFSDLDEVCLAYVISIHKSQGSEYPCVVIPIDTSHFKLLYRNLLYTGITRGKSLVVLVGQKQALGMAVRNQQVEERHTALREAIQEMI